MQRSSQTAKHKQILIEELRPFADKPKKKVMMMAILSGLIKVNVFTVNPMLLNKKNSNKSSNNNNTTTNTTIKQPSNQEEIDFRKPIAKWNLVWASTLVD